MKNAEILANPSHLRLIPGFTISRRRLLLSTAATAAAMVLPNLVSGQSLPVAYQRKLVVTIDDGPATGSGRDLATFLRISRALRSGFEAEKVPAIMFINERQLNVDGERDERAKVLHEWLEAGLDLGNHTYSHLNLGQVGLERFCDDVIKGEVITRPLLESRGRKLSWFRYPFLASGSGDTAKAVEDFLTQRGYRIAPVSVDYRDYSFAGAYVRDLQAGDAEKAAGQFAVVCKALDEAFQRAEARSLEVLGYELPQCLLIHCNEMNALTMRTTLERIRRRGYSFVSMDEAMQDPAYATQGLRPGEMGGGGFFNSLTAAKGRAGGGR